MSSFSKGEPILTVKDLKDRFFFGVDLRDGNGNELPDRVMEKYIDQAVDWLEHQLEVCIYKKLVEHYIDYRLAEYRQYCFLQVDQYPINQVMEVELKFSDSMKITFPEQWYKVYPNAGQIQLLPTASTLSAVIIAQSGQILPRAVPGESAPSLMRVLYYTGFNEDDIPPLINETIGLRATNLILNFLGDISPAGPGISSVSQSVDGMSQSTSTAISATNALFGARMLNNDKMIEANLKLLKKKYKGIKLAHI